MTAHLKPPPFLTELTRSFVVQFVFKKDWKWRQSIVSLCLRHTFCGKKKALSLINTLQHLFLVFTEVRLVVWILVPPRTKSCSISEEVCSLYLTEMGININSSLFFPLRYSFTKVWIRWLNDLFYSWLQRFPLVSLVIFPFIDFFLCVCVCVCESNFSLSLSLRVKWIQHRYTSHCSAYGNGRWHNLSHGDQPQFRLPYPKNHHISSLHIEFLG